MQSSEGMIKFLRITQVKIKIQGKNYNNITDIYFKSGCMPVLWKKFYVKNRPQKFIQNCCEKHYCHFNER